MHYYFNPETVVEKGLIIDLEAQTCEPEDSYASDQCCNPAFEENSDGEEEF